MHQIYVSFFGGDNLIEVIRCHNGRCYRLLYDKMFEEYYLVEELNETEKIVEENYLSEELEERLSEELEYLEYLEELDGTEEMIIAQ